ncbi:MAG TPA: class F sortase [Candidatus Saccharimonadales bacterium]|jgi:hypothetical protein
MVGKLSTKNRWQALWVKPSIFDAKRAAHFSLRFSAKSTLRFSLRKFFLKKNYRSKRQRQLVVPLGGLGGFKQLAVTLERRQRKNLGAPRDAALSYLLLIMIGIGGVGYFTAEALGAKTLEPVAQFTLPAPEIGQTVSEQPKFLDPSEPIRLQISKVGIDSSIVKVGQDKNGAMETPDIFSNDAGWYQHSPTPGEQGPAIIVGHVDNLNGPSVFWRLRELSSGDTVKVTRADGKVVEFTVDMVKQFEQANFPSHKVYGNIAYSGLRLITCGGAYSPQTDSYSHNMVVFASSKSL